MSQHWPFYFTWVSQSEATYLQVTDINMFSFFCQEYKSLEIWDLSSISYQAGFGLKNETYKDAILSMLNTSPILSPKFISTPKLKITEKLINFIGLKSGKVFYTVSGAESIENALKMARDFTRKNIILARQKSYHGATLGALSVTGDWRNKVQPTVDNWVKRIPEPQDDPDLSKTRNLIKDIGPENIAAFCLETISGTNGVIIPSEKWYRGIQEICNEFNILLILDEVITGFYRTGKPLGLCHYHFLKPDFICLSKMITGGYVPFGAVWTSQRISDFYNDRVLSCGLTNYAHPMGLAAMENTLNICNESEFQNLLTQNISIFKSKLERIKLISSVKAIRQIGLMAAIEVERPLEIKYFLKNGIYLNIRDNMLLLAPALNYNSLDLENAMNLLEKTIKGL